MAWSEEPGAGFTEPDAEPWLPIADAHACNVADQRGDSLSALALTRDLIALRRELDDLATGSYERLGSPAGTWMWRRGEGAIVALNPTDWEVELEVSGTIRVCTDRARDGERIAGRLQLHAWEGAVVAPD
jgi:hypothetical protein